MRFLAVNNLSSKHVWLFTHELNVRNIFHHASPAPPSRLSSYVSPCLLLSIRFYCFTKQIDSVPCGFSSYFSWFGAGRGHPGIRAGAFVCYINISKTSKWPCRRWWLVWKSEARAEPNMLAWVENRFPSGETEYYGSLLFGRVSDVFAKLVTSNWWIHVTLRWIAGLFDLFG